MGISVTMVNVLGKTRSQRGIEAFIKYLKDRGENLIYLFIFIK